MSHIHIYKITYLHIISLHCLAKMIPCYMRPDMHVFPLKEGRSLIWSHMHIMNKHPVDFVSQARNERDLRYRGNLIGSVNIINTVRSDQRLSAGWVHYCVPALSRVGGCFSKKKKGTTLQTADKSGLLCSKLLHQSNTDRSTLWRWCTALF